MKILKKIIIITVITTNTLLGMVGQFADIEYLTHFNQLAKSIHANDNKNVIRLIDEKINPVLTTHQKDVLLGIALRAKNKFALDELIQRGVDLNKNSQESWLPIFTAIDFAPELLPFLITKGMNPHKINETGMYTGWSPILFAAYRGSPEAVQELLKYNVAVNKPNKLGETPLIMLALQLSNPHAMATPYFEPRYKKFEALLYAGANPFIKNTITPDPREHDKSAYDIINAMTPGIVRTRLLDLMQRFSSAKL